MDWTIVVKHTRFKDNCVGDGLLVRAPLLQAGRVLLVRQCETKQWRRQQIPSPATTLEGTFCLKQEDTPCGRGSNFLQLILCSRHVNRKATLLLSKKTAYVLRHASVMQETTHVLGQHARHLSQEPCQKCKIFPPATGSERDLTRATYKEIYEQCWDRRTAREKPALYSGEHF